MILQVKLVILVKHYYAPLDENSLFYNLYHFRATATSSWCSLTGLASSCRTSSRLSRVMEKLITGRVHREVRIDLLLLENMIYI